MGLYKWGKGLYTQREVCVWFYVGLYRVKLIHWSLWYIAHRMPCVLSFQYLVYDTQIMMGGGKMYAISPEEYIFAALNLYLDIVNLFLYILQLISAARGD